MQILKKALAEYALNIDKIDCMDIVQYTVRHYPTFQKTNERDMVRDLV